MKKLCLTVFAILLLALCACSKQPAPEQPAAVDTPAPEQPQAATPAKAEDQPAEPEPQPTEAAAQPEAYIAAEDVPDLPLRYAGYNTVSRLHAYEIGPVSISYCSVTEAYRFVPSDTLCVGADSAQPEYYSAANGALTRCPAQRYELDLELPAYGQMWHVCFECWQTEGGLAVRNLTDRQQTENAASVQALSGSSTCVLLHGPDRKLALFDLEHASAEPVLQDLPFTPASIYPNGSGSRYLLCEQTGGNDLLGEYVWYLDDANHPLEILNDRPFGVTYPPHVRWRGDDELVYDIENPETGKFTTYLYNVLTQTEQILLADYDPYPFCAEDTASERYLLVHDTYALRVERGGTVTIRNLSDGTEQVIAGFTLPEYYNHLYVGSGDMVFYRATHQNSDSWEQIGFIDCATGSCAVLNRRVPDTLHEAYDLLPLSETAFAIQASAETEFGTQNYLLIYDVSSWHNPPFAGDITLYAGSDTALVNSEPVQMPAAPFVEDEIFYIPLQFVAEILGWDYQYKDGTVRLQSSLHWTTLTVGERSICADGIEATVTGCEPDTPRSACVPDSYVPVERSGFVFIPFNFLSIRTDNDTRSNLSFHTQMFPEDGYVIIQGGGKEEGIGGFYVWDIYDDLPAEQRAPMEELGVVGFSRDAYDVVEYGADGLFVHVLRLRDGCEDWDRLDGVVSAVYTTNQDYPTPRGLRVGDSISRIYTTYSDYFYMQLLCITAGDVITQIRFTSYYDVDERIREQPQNLHMDAATAAGQDGLPSSE